jgi:beta-ribofuranosylaminobenzene 5'-phosphate synthase
MSADAGGVLEDMHPPSLPLRMLLGTDGSVTSLLEAWFGAPVAVETISNRLDHGRPRTLHRSAVLRAGAAGRPLLRARSVLAIERLPSDARTALLTGNEPIGAVLREARLETRRELLRCDEVAATAEDAAILGIEEGSAIFERSSRIVGLSHELAVVTERVPASLFDSVPA